MRFQRGQKFHIKNAEYLITIEGGMSGAQGIHRRYPNQDHYTVNINGSRMFISELQLVLFMRGQKKEVEQVVLEKPVIDVEAEKKKKEIESLAKQRKVESEMIDKTEVKPEKKGGFLRWKK